MAKVNEVSYSEIADDLRKDSTVFDLGRDGSEGEALHTDRGSTILGWGIWGHAVTLTQTKFHGECLIYSDSGSTRMRTATVAISQKPHRR